jgi:PAS domain S-box-containing protein
MAEKPDALDRRLLELALRGVQSQALILLDSSGVIIDWLAGAERLFGYRVDEIIGQQVNVLFTPEDIRRDVPAWEQKTAADSGISEDDRWQMRKDGGRVWVSEAMTAIRDPQGNLLGFAKIMRDRMEAGGPHTPKDICPRLAP